MELKVASRFLRPENVQVRSETRPTAVTSRRRKRRFGTVPGVGMAPEAGGGRTLEGLQVRSGGSMGGHFKVR